MIAYLDSSVLLRVILGQRNALKEWRSIERGVASALVEVECLRTLDLVRLAEEFDDADVAARREAVYRLIEAMEIVELTGPVLSRASQPLPTALGTLDALHLATALLWREQTAADLVMATHDEALATAATASGLRVIGRKESTSVNDPRPSMACGTHETCEKSATCGTSDCSEFWVF